MLVGFKWLDEGLAQNYTDLFLPELLARDVRRLPIEHEVRSPSGRFVGRASCLLTVSGKKLIFDYEAFMERNKEAEMLLGIAKCTYEKKDSDRFREVCWKPFEGEKFYTSKVLNVTRREAPSRREISRLNPSWVDAKLQEMSQAKLKAHLPKVGSLPVKVEITTSSFIRNPYVVAYALRRANGVCQRCLIPAPFLKAATGAPYLEVHHKVRLSEGGSDDAENTIALCPNCHREFHHG